MPAAEQADSYTTSGVISMIQGLHYKQVNGRDEPMLQNNKPNNKLNNKPNNKLNNKFNNKLNLKKRLFPMLLVLALLSGSVPGALPAAAVTTDGYVASETGGRSFRSCPPVPPVSFHYYSFLTFFAEIQCSLWYSPFRRQGTGRSGSLRHCLGAFKCSIHLYVPVFLC